MTVRRDTPHYIAVFWWLLGLTLAEVVVIFLPLARLATGFLLVGFALSKASLVAMYFMHLRFERRVLALIAITPVILCLFLLFGLLPDHAATPHRSTAPAQPSTAPH
ncbi:MAG: oxidase [Candidatus Methylomirabilota bacterium]|nr:cytochrome C oxidase subunit IV family protein [Candidatus Methylomirabilis sp.]NJD68331.1 oxidase [candidate division NC10 bacterium]PWB42414.1 MAG: oxidase [candidate division NC10 bacterium]